MKHQQEKVAGKRWA